MASAQLDILLGALPPAPPRAGACGVYRFVSEEASGIRRVEFSACIERVTSSEVRLRLWSGDSLSTAIVADPALFTRRRGALLDYIRTVEETVRGERRVLSRADWESMPGLERIVPLAAGRDSSLGTRSFDIDGRSIGAQGKQRRESETKTRKISGIEMTQTASRVVETWTAPEAPLFGLVRGEAIIESDRRLARPIAGIPESGRRHQVVRLEWIGASERERLPARKPR